MKITKFIDTLKLKYATQPIIYSLVSEIDLGFNKTTAWKSSMTRIESGYNWSLLKPDMIMYAGSVAPEILSNTPNFTIPEGSTTKDLIVFLEKYYDPSLEVIFNVFTLDDFPEIHDSRWMDFCTIINDDFPIDGLVSDMKSYSFKRRS